MTAEHNISALWEPFEIAEDALVVKNIGDLNLWCRLFENQILIAYNHQAEDAGIDCLADIPPETVWSRWAMPIESATLQLVPMFPDRAMVVKPEESFRLIPQVRTRINARVPIWIGIDFFQGDKTSRLAEIPTVVLSKTWFGSFTDGEGCYWISSGLRAKIDPDPQRYYQAICPIEVVNNSNAELLIDKICLRVANLALFFGENQLWSDETNIVFEGKDEVSQVTTTGAPPPEAPGTVRVSEPRTPMKKGFTANTFDTLKDLPWLGTAFRQKINQR